MDKHNTEENGLKETQKMVLSFLVYAFLGWLLETLFCLVTQAQFMKRGFLYGPLCPMYGFAAIGMIQMLKNIKTNTIGKFCICMVVFTAFEYVVAVVLECLFGLRWWDYTNEVLNFQGRISLPYSIAWGIVGTIFVEKIHPFVKRKVDKYSAMISKNVQIVLLYMAVAIIIIDFMLSIIKYINIPRLIELRIYANIAQLVDAEVVRSEASYNISMRNRVEQLATIKEQNLKFIKK